MTPENYSLDQDSNEKSIKASIIVPAYNEAEYIYDLIYSVKKYLQDEAEIIIVDNGSTDATAEIAQSNFNCNLIRLDKKTFPSSARNIGALAACSEILIFLDSDIIVTNTWGQEISKIINSKDFLNKRCITGETYHISTEPSFIEKFWFLPLRSKKKQYINGGNIVVRKTIFEELSGFDDELETGEDVDFCKRARENNIKVVFNKDLFVHHEGFPKTIKQFFKRERWHGKGDFSSAKRFLHSKVALIASLLFALSIIFTISLVLVIYMHSNLPFVWGVLLPLLLIVLICFASSIKTFKGDPFKQILIGAVIYVIYFSGRMLSGIDVLLEKIRPPNQPTKQT